MRSLLIVMLAACPAGFSQPAPAAADQAQLIEQIRQRALAYLDQLPNFICTLTTTHYLDYSATGKSWEQTDTTDEQLAFFGKHETYKTISVNGKPPESTRRHAGISSTGEFGSMLNSIFHPDSQAKFKWSRWETLRGRPVYVFSYRVAKAHSVGIVSMPGRRVVVGYHGLVFADRDTRTVLRMVVNAETPSSVPFEDLSYVLDYGRIPIGREEFVLPLQAELRSKTDGTQMMDGRRRLMGRKVLARNDIHFEGYRKYTAEAAIKFESDEKPTGKKQ